jgi:hypothetical protein
MMRSGYRLPAEYGSLAQTPWQIALAMLAFLAFSNSALAEVIRRADWPACRDGGCSLGADLKGEINGSALDELIRLEIETRGRALAEKKPITRPVIFLDSPGGSVTAAIAIGRLFRAKGVLAVVPPNAICLSACVLVLAGAPHRGFNIDAGAKIGIHRPYLEVPPQKVSPEGVKLFYGRMLQEIRSYFREMNILEQLADAMLRVEPENMRLLTKGELDAYGLTQQDPIDKELEQLRAAQQLGVSRAEYMRRLQLIDQTCTADLTLDEILACFKAIYETGARR